MRRENLGDICRRLKSQSSWVARIHERLLCESALRRDDIIVVASKRNWKTDDRAGIDWAWSTRRINVIEMLLAHMCPCFHQLFADRCNPKINTFSIIGRMTSVQFRVFVIVAHRWLSWLLLIVLNQCVRGTRCYSWRQFFSNKVNWLLRLSGLLLLARTGNSRQRASHAMYNKQMIVATWRPSQGDVKDTCLHFILDWE